MNVYTDSLMTWRIYHLKDELLAPPTPLCTVVLKAETITRIAQQMMRGIVCACRRGPDAGTVGKPAKMGVVISTIPPGLARGREREFFPLSA